MKRNNKGFLYGWMEWFLAISIVVLIAFGVVGLMASIESPQEKQQIYAVWCKANPTVNLTFEEWDLLRNKDLLPNTPDLAKAQAEKNGIATGLAVGLAVGGSK